MKSLHDLLVKLFKIIVKSQVKVCLDMEDSMKGNYNMNKIHARLY